jgi:hypothetical protein
MPLNSLELTRLNAGPEPQRAAAVMKGKTKPGAGRKMFRPSLDVKYSCLNQGVNLYAPIGQIRYGPFNRYYPGQCMREYTKSKAVRFQENIGFCPTSDLFQFQFHDIQQILYRW